MSPPKSIAHFVSLLLLPCFILSPVEGLAADPAMANGIRAAFEPSTPFCDEAASRQLMATEALCPRLSQFRYSKLNKTSMVWVARALVGAGALTFAASHLPASHLHGESLPLSIAAFALLASYSAYQQFAQNARVREAIRFGAGLHLAKSRNPSTGGPCKNLAAAVTPKTLSDSALAEALRQAGFSGAEEAIRILEGYADAGEAVRYFPGSGNPYRRATSEEEITRRWVNESLKKSVPAAVLIAAAEMAPHVPRNAALVPIPSSQGDVSVNGDLVDAILALRPDARRVDALALAHPRKGVWQRYRDGEFGLEPESLSFKAAPGALQLLGRDPVLFIDNVLDSGVSFESARRALGNRGRGLAFARTDDYVPWKKIAGLNQAERKELGQCLGDKRRSLLEESGLFQPHPAAPAVGVIYGRGPAQHLQQAFNSLSLSLPHYLQTRDAFWSTRLKNGAAAIREILITKVPRDEAAFINHVLNAAWKALVERISERLDPLQVEPGFMILIKNDERVIRAIDRAQRRFGQAHGTVALDADYLKAVLDAVEELLDPKRPPAAITAQTLRKPLDAQRLWRASKPSDKGRIESLMGGMIDQAIGGMLAAIGGIGAGALKDRSFDVKQAGRKGAIEYHRMANQTGLRFGMFIGMARSGMKQSPPAAGEVAGPESADSAAGRVTNRRRTTEDVTGSAAGVMRRGSPPQEREDPEQRQADHHYTQQDDNRIIHSDSFHLPGGGRVSQPANATTPPTAAPSNPIFRLIRSVRNLVTTTAVRIYFAASGKNLPPSSRRGSSLMPDRSLPEQPASVKLNPPPAAAPADNKERQGSLLWVGNLGLGVLLASLWLVMMVHGGAFPGYSIGRLAIDEGAAALVTLVVHEVLHFPRHLKDFHLDRRGLHWTKIDDWRLSFGPMGSLFLAVTFNFGFLLFPHVPMLMILGVNMLAVNALASIPGTIWFSKMAEGPSRLRRWIGKTGLFLWKGTDRDVARRIRKAQEAKAAHGAAEPDAVLELVSTNMRAEAAYRTAKETYLQRVKDALERARKPPVSSDAAALVALRIDLLVLLNDGIRLEEQVQRLWDRLLQIIRLETSRRGEYPPDEAMKIAGAAGPAALFRELGDPELRIRELVDVYLKLEQFSEAASSRYVVIPLGLLLPWVVHALPGIGDVASGGFLAQTDPWVTAHPLSVWFVGAVISIVLSIVYLAIRRYLVRSDFRATEREGEPAAAPAAYASLGQREREAFIDPINPRPDIREALAAFRLHRLPREEALKRLGQIGIVDVGLANAYLTRAASPAAMAEEAPPKPGGVPARKHRVLVVDDDADYLNSLAGLLSAAGYDVVGVNGGAAALRELEGAAFDLVITDWQMPVMDGVALIQELRQTRPSLPIILTSGRNRSLLLKTAERLGVEAAQKGEEPEDLLNQIARLLEPPPAAAGHGSDLSKPTGRAEHGALIVQAVMQEYAEQITGHEHVVKTALIRAQHEPTYDAVSALIKKAPGLTREIAKKMVEQVRAKAHPMVRRAGKRGDGLKMKSAPAAAPRNHPLADLVTRYQELRQAALDRKRGHPASDNAWPAVPEDAGVLIDRMLRASEEIPAFTDPLTAIRWLQERRRELPSPKTAPGQEPAERSLSHLMRVLWAGERLRDEQGELVSNHETWILSATAANYALRRKALIEPALRQLWNSLPLEERRQFQQAPVQFFKRLQGLRLISLMDDGKPEKRQRKISAYYRRLVLEMAVALYGEEITRPDGSAAPRKPGPAPRKSMPGFPNPLLDAAPAMGQLEQKAGPLEARGEFGFHSTLGAKSRRGPEKPDRGARDSSRTPTSAASRSLAQRVSVVPGGGSEHAAVSKPRVLIPEVAPQVTWADLDQLVTTLNAIAPDILQVAIDPALKAWTKDLDLQISPKPNKGAKGQYPPPPFTVSVTPLDWSMPGAVRTKAVPPTTVLVELALLADENLHAGFLPVTVLVGVREAIGNLTDAKLSIDLIPGFRLVYHILSSKFQFPGKGQTLIDASLRGLGLSRATIKSARHVLAHVYLGRRDPALAISDLRDLGLRAGVAAAVVQRVAPDPGAAQARKHLYWLWLTQQILRIDKRLEPGQRNAARRQLHGTLRVGGKRWRLRDLMEEFYQKTSATRRVQFDPMTRQFVLKAKSGAAPTDTKQSLPVSTLALPAPAAAPTGPGKSKDKKGSMLSVALIAAGSALLGSGAGAFQWGWPKLTIVEPSSIGLQGLILAASGVIYLLGRFGRRPARLFMAPTLLAGAA